MILYKFFLCYFLWILRKPFLNACENVEACLIKRLFDRGSYDNRARPLPMFNADVAIRVILQIDLYRLIDVDVRQGKISLHAFITEIWSDPRLDWNPIDFANMTTIFMDSNTIWIPDTALINAATTSDNRPSKNLARIEVVYDQNLGAWTKSKIHLSYSTVLEPFCIMDTRYFPFDRQICYVILGSLNYDASKLEYHSAYNRITLERFENMGEWTMSGFQIQEDYVFYNCCRLPFSQLTARLVITRKPLFYVVNLILPTLITNLLATVGLFSNLRTYGGELTAVTLGLTTLLAFSILLLSISEQMARGSHWISLMGCYFGGIIIQTCVATITSVYLMRTERRVRFKRILCRKEYTHRQIRQKISTVLNGQKITGSDLLNLDNDQRKIDDQESDIDNTVENWCICFHIVFTLTFTLIVLTVGAVNAYI